MPLRHWSLLQLIERDMNVLEPFMRLLNEQFNQFFLETVYGVGSHDLSPSQQGRFAEEIEQN
jgi:hypothetical protein